MICCFSFRSGVILPVVLSAGAESDVAFARTQTLLHAGLVLPPRDCVSALIPAPSPALQLETLHCSPSPARDARAVARARMPTRGAVTAAMITLDRPSPRARSAPRELVLSVGELSKQRRLRAARADWIPSSPRRRDGRSH